MDMVKDTIELLEIRLIESESSYIYPGRFIGDGWLWVACVRLTLMSRSVANTETYAKSPLHVFHNSSAFHLIPYPSSYIGLRTFGIYWMLFNIFHT